MTAAEWIKELEETENTGISIDVNSTNSNMCPKCGGTGILKEYSHIAGGLCFYCNGTKKDPHHKAQDIKLTDIVSNVENLTKRETLRLATWINNHIAEYRIEGTSKTEEKLVVLGFLNSRQSKPSGKYTIYTPAEKLQNSKINWL